MTTIKHTALIAISIVCGLFILSPGADLLACSTIKLQHGPELLYGHNLNNNGSDIPGLVFINKRDVFKTGRSWSELINKDQSNPSTAAWISRYGSVTFNTFGKDLPDGGMNEAGIYIWEMGLSNSEVVYPKDASLPNLNQMHWMQYILDTAATLDEALAPGGHPNSPTCGHPKLLHLS
jgi:choloylglycine hydrolase